GVKVTAVEIDPQIVELAKTYFDKPPAVDVRVSDARAFLRHDREKYDLIFLDTFASESTPWHMLTTEAFAEMKARLNPGGRLLINTVAYAGASGRADGIGPTRVEATIRAVFPDALVYPEPPQTSEPDELINVTIV